MGMTLTMLGALAYCAIAVGLIVLAAKRSRRGLVRTGVVATLVAIFFSISFLVDDGVIPVPALAVTLWCATGDCTKMYGAWGGVTWGLLPLLVQWVLLLIVFVAVHKLAGVLRRKPGNGA
jgi:4-amino-4-deoxy-L-arabinose transferase-like glycosyltransferase